jgi:predicted chitinase
MAAKEIIAKKYVVRLGDGERDQLATLIRKGQRGIAHFIAQIATESVGLSRLDENLTYTTVARSPAALSGPAEN